MTFRLYYLNTIYMLSQLKPNGHIKLDKIFSIIIAAFVVTLNRIKYYSSVHFGSFDNNLFFAEHIRNYKCKMLSNIQHRYFIAVLFYVIIYIYIQYFIPITSKNCSEFSNIGEMKKR